MAGSLPKLMKFQEEHAELKDRFALLAFHDASAKTFGELDARLAERRIPERYWGGRDLTLPVLLDSTGATIRQFGIRAFPTMVLVNPEGVLVHTDADEEILLAKLRDEKGDAPEGADR